MELDDKKIDAHWTKDVNGKPQFFIINEAIMSKLCILGEKAEPCFEGAQIVKFSLDESLKEKIFSLMTEMQEILSKGGISMPNENEGLQNENIEVIDVDTPIDYEEVPVAEEPVVEETAPAVEEPVVEEAVPAIEETEPVAAYDLEQIPEYVSLRDQYAQLEQDNNSAREEIKKLNSQIKELANFKACVEKKEKEAMINSFDMLSDADKLDVVTNIDTYSVDEIEAKLSVICVRNRVKFDDESSIQEPQTTFSLNESIEDDTAPAWIQLVREVQKKLN